MSKKLTSADADVNYPYHILEKPNAIFLTYDSISSSGIPIDNPYSFTIS